MKKSKTIATSWQSSPPIDPALELQRAETELAKRSLAEFVRQAWRIIEPATALIWNWHLDLVCASLQALTEGRMRKLVVNIPPGSGKSSVVSVLWPVWVWARAPHTRWLFASYKESLALRDSVRRRVVICSEWYQRRWPIKFAGDANQKTEFHNEQQGHMVALGSGGSTGFRGDYLVLDDPNNALEMESETQRESVLRWVDLNWSTRGNKDARECVIQQRTHERDVSGYVLSQGGWSHLKIQMELEKAAPEDPRTQPGELMWPARFSREAVEELKRRLGPYGSAGQLQQNPAPLGGGIFKASWFNRWRHSLAQPNHIEIEEATFDPNRTLRFCVIDPAITEQEIAGNKLTDPDYTVISAWCVFALKRGPALLLMDLVRERMEGPDIVPRIAAMHRHWRFATIGVETVAFQKILFQEAKRRGLPVREISTKNNEDSLYRIDKDKVARALSATPLMADRRFYVPDYAPWLADYLAEMLAFPNAAHDDQVDVSAFAVAIAEKYRPGTMPAVQDRPFRSGDFSDDSRRSEQDKPIDPLEGFFLNPGK